MGNYAPVRDVLAPTAPLRERAIKPSMGPPHSHAVVAMKIVLPHKQVLKHPNQVHSRTPKHLLNTTVCTSVPTVLLVHTHIMCTHLQTATHNNLPSWITATVDVLLVLLMLITTMGIILSRVPQGLSLWWVILHHCYWDHFIHSTCNSTRLVVRDGQAVTLY